MTITELAHHVNKVRYDEDSPAIWAKTVDVYLEANFIKIIDIDTINQRFQAEALIESKWHDPAITSLNEKFDEKTMWTPELYVDNGVKDVKEEVTYKLTTASDTNEIFVHETRKVKGVFWENLELQSFPLDVQDLSLFITTRKPGTIVKFKIKQEDKYIPINSILDKSSWVMHNILKIQFASLERDFSYGTFKYPAVKVKSQAFRLPGFFYWNAVLPIFLVTLASLCPFTIDMKLPQSRLPSTATMLLTSVGMRWTIGRFLPTVSYLTSIDKYSIGSIVIIVAQLVYHAIISAFFSYLPTSLSYLIDKIAFTSFVSLIFFKQIVFALWIVVKTQVRKDIKAHRMVYDSLQASSALLNDLD